jgi:tetratricopeptide (TPR) repeat protein
MTNMEMKSVRSLVLPLLHAALLGMVLSTQVACTAAGGREATKPAAEQSPVAQKPSGNAEALADSAGQPQPLTRELLYDILLAEIAGQRGRMDVSAPHYLQAAMESRDPRVAERAVQIASFAKQYDIALRAAQHWLELDPSSVEARKVVTALAMKLGDMDEVVKQLDYLVSTAKNHTLGFHLATGILARHADKSAALDAMEKLAARYPDSPQARLGVCRAAIMANELERALVAVEEALQMEPGMEEALPEAEILRAQVLVRQEKSPLALEFLANAAQRQPNDATLQFGYGKLLLDAGDIEGAKRQFGKVVKLEPENDDALFSLALLELETKEIKSAKRHLQQLLEHEENQQAVYYYLGYAEEQDGNQDAAIKWYRQVEDEEYWTQSRLRVSMIMVEQGRLEEVRREMQALRMNNPENSIDFYLIEGQVLSESGLDQEAFELYSMALVSHPDDEKLRYARALVAEKIDLLDTAEQDLRYILQQDPDNIKALNALGYTLADRTDRYQEALGYIERAYASKPDDPAIVDSMGWVHYRLGNLDKAQGYLEQAFRMSGDGEIGAHLGEVLWVKGDREGARQVWKEAQEKDPDNPVLRGVINRYLP